MKKLCHPFDTNPREKSFTNWTLPLLAIIVCYFLVFLFWGISRHWGNLNSLNDIGVFDQAVWSVLNLGSLNNTIVYSEPINLLGFHFMPILYGFVPLYYITPSVHWFTVVQTAAISLTAYPIYLISKEITGSGKASFFWGLAFLFNPFILNADAWDFHPITLTLPFIAMGILSVAQKKFKQLLFCCFIILLCKEHLGGMVAGFGVLWWLKHRGNLHSVGMLVLGLCHSLLVLGVIMPSLSPTGEHIMLSAEMGQLSRYAWMGETPREILLTLFTRPLWVIESVIFKNGGWAYLCVLVMPFLGLSVIGLELLLPSLADLAANLLSANLMPKSPFGYHSAAIIPFMAAAAIYGSQRLHHIQNKFSLSILAGLSLCLSIFSGYILSPVLPLPGAANFWAPKKLINYPDPIVKQIAAHLPNDVPVSAQANIGAHFSQRKEIFLYPNNLKGSQAIILYLKSPTLRIELEIPKGMGNLGHHLQMCPKKYLKSIDRPLSSKAWGISYWNDPWLVLLRGARNTIPETIVRNKVKLLRTEWGINS